MLSKDIQARANAQCLLDRFVADAGVEHLAFPPSLSSRERSAVHLLADRAGLQHGSVGAGIERRLLVSKQGARPPALSSSPDADGPLANGGEGESAVAWLPLDVLSTSAGAIDAEPNSAVSTKSL
ncbi:hypothetical protein T492DRAFT_890743 [Pavlovales sp. CCMP2436]|nr:hypothetical protein T492DRAFT_890743 [Pavlovales sp. CCMP2436]